LRVIFPPVGRAAEVVKERVAETPVLYAKRSAAAMENVTPVGTGTPIPPEATPADATVSESV